MKWSTVKVSYKQQAEFSFAYWPFSVKLLWAPIGWVQQCQIVKQPSLSFFAAIYLAQIVCSGCDKILCS